MSTQSNEAQTSKNKFFNSVLLILLGLALGWLVQFLREERTPNPTFKVGNDKVTIIPDRTLGADQVTISVFGSDSTLLLTKTISVDSSFAYAFPATGAKTLRILQEYLCKGCLIKCCDNEATVMPGTEGTPIVVTDVILRQNPTLVANVNASIPTSNWCICTWGDDNSVDDPNNTGTRSFTWGPGSSNSPHVRRLIVSDGTNIATLYIKTIGTTSGTTAQPGDHAQYSSADNFACSLSPASGFSYTLPNGTPSSTPTAYVKYTNGSTFNFTVKTTRANSGISGGALVEQRIWITCPSNLTVTEALASSCGNPVE